MKIEAAEKASWDLESKHLVWKIVMSTFDFRSVSYLFSKFQTCQSVLEKNFEGGGGKYTELTNRNWKFIHFLENFFSN